MIPTFVFKKEGFSVVSNNHHCKFLSIFFQIYNFESAENRHCFLPLVSL